MEQRVIPLGLPADRWDRLRDDLRKALSEEGLQSVDGRLQGTSAWFFSKSPDKSFPQTPDEVLQQVEEGRNGKAALATWRDAGYERSGPRPRKHFWDSRCNLGLSRETSDYDFQLASDDLAQRFERYAAQKGIPRNDLISKKGGHYRQNYLEEVAPALFTWMDVCGRVTGRVVNIASFESSGPMGMTAFSILDWVIEEPVR